VLFAPSQVVANVTAAELAGRLEKEGVLVVAFFAAGEPAGGFICTLLAFLGACLFAGNALQGVTAHCCCVLFWGINFS
jgi:hypothetical protein